MNIKSHLIAVILGTAMAAQAANLIQNGSFETNSVSGTYTGSGNELGGNPIEASSGSVEHWLRTGRAWIFFDDGTRGANFPDGSCAFGLDASPNHNGIDVIAQTGLSLVAGTTYKLTFDLFGRGGGGLTAPLDARFTHTWTDALVYTNGTGTTVLDEKTTVKGDGASETVTVYFTPTVTDADYAVQFFMDNSVQDGDHAYIDSVELVEVNHEIQNGSFEEATNQSLNTGTYKNQGCELGTGTAAAGNTITACGVANWSGGGRTWYTAATNTTVTPIATFPDGEWCAQIDARADIAGVDVLAQSGFALVAGKLYELTFEIWGAHAVTAALDVRFAYGVDNVLDHTSGTGVTVLDEKTTVGNDGVAESVTVRFTPTVSAVYALQFFADDSGNSNAHIWIDNVMLVQLERGTLVLIQ